MITASEDGTARVWRVGSDQEPLLLGKHGTDVRAAAFSPDGQRAATADASGVLRLWRLDRATDPFLILRGHAKKINTVVFTADGPLVATASDDGTARVWNSETGSEEATLPHTDSGAQRGILRWWPSALDRSAGRRSAQLGDRMAGAAQDAPRPHPSHA